MISMGDLVKFRRRECRVVPFEKVSTDTDEVLADGSDMRSMASLLCCRCGHKWIQPKAGGRCAKCHADNPIVMERRVNALERL